VDDIDPAQRVYPDARMIVDHGLSPLAARRQVLATGGSQVWNELTA